MEKTYSQLAIELSNTYSGLDLENKLIELYDRQERSSKMANGGYIKPFGVSANESSQYNYGGLSEFSKDAGKHESSPYEGIPIGVDGNGIQNKVEGGETKWNDYIFSNRLTLDKDTVRKHNLPIRLTGKSFADASKIISKIHKERPNDPISKNTAEDHMKRLMYANDSVREDESSMMAMGGNLYAGGSPLNIDRSQDVSYAPLAYRGENAKLWNALENKKYDNTTPFQGLNQKLESKKLLDNAKNLTSNIKEKPDFWNDPKNLRYAPIAFDALAATGLLGKTPTPTEYSPTLISQPGYLTPEQIDEQAMRSAIDTSYNTSISSLAEASGGSGAALRSGITGLSSGYAKTLGEAFSNANRANIEQRQAAKQFNLQQQGNIAAQNVNALNQGELYNNQLINAARAKNYEDRMSYLAKGAEGLGDIGYEQRLMEIMPRIYGYSDLGKYSPTVKKCGGRLRLKNHKK